jgi:hypothetical protein
MSREGLPLWEPRRGAAYRDGMDTMQDAADDITPVTGKLRKRVYAEIVKRGEYGATCDELEVALGLTHQTCSARVNELMRARAIIGTGKRPTRSGRKARVWCAARGGTTC